MVDQLNLGSSLLVEEAPRLRLARLNHRAGRKAKAAAAHGPALAYLERGMALLPEDAWRTQHDLVFQLSCDAAECAYMVGNPALGDALTDTALARAATRLELAQIHDLRLVVHSVKSDWAAAIAWGKAGLRLLGIELPEQDFDRAVASELAATKESIGTRRPEQIVELPALCSDDDRACARIFSNLLPAAFWGDRTFYRLLILRSARFTLEHGLSEYSGHLLADYGMVLSFQGDYAPACAFGRLGLELGRRFPDRYQEAKALLIFSAWLNHWREPLTESVPLLQQTFAAAMESGNLQYAAYAELLLSMALMSLGTPLDRVLGQADKGLAFSNKVGNRGAYHSIRPLRQAVQCLKGRTAGVGSLGDDGFDEEHFGVEARNNPLALFYLGLMQLQTAYLFGDLARADQAVRTAEQFRDYGRSFIAEVDFVFYAALTAIARLDRDPTPAIDRPAAWTRA